MLSQLNPKEEPFSFNVPTIGRNIIYLNYFFSSGCSGFLLKNFFAISLPIKQTFLPLEISRLFNGLPYARLNPF